MIFKEKLSNQMSQAIKANSTIKEREGVAAHHEMSIHTLNSVINMQRNITVDNSKALTELIGVCVKNAYDNATSLVNYSWE
jgi:hypothetical protein|tara:strand:- start:771 stop:1013 length:243 start_codon:yes stop_codon:yes gene_type:complete